MLSFLHVCLSNLYWGSHVGVPGRSHPFHPFTDRLSYFIHTSTCLFSDMIIVMYHTKNTKKRTTNWGPHADKSWSWTKEASFLLWSMSQRPLAAGEDSILCFKLRAIVSPMSTSEMAYGPAWKPMAVCVAASARCIIWSSLFRRPDDLVAAKVRAEQQSVPWHSAPACGFCFSTRPDHDYPSSDAPLWIRIGPNIKQT